MFCPNCGNARLHQFEANLPVADFFCANCQDQYELKSQKKPFGKKIVNGAYETKIRRLESDSSPHLILMNYSLKYSSVESVIVIPRRFFIHSIVEKRKPLSESAKRAGWVGSNILLEKIPQSGRIHVVQNGKVRPKEEILAQWQNTAFLNKLKSDSRGWLINVMKIVELLGKSEFSLSEIYEQEYELQRIYPANRHVRPKIRQQLQVLRDNGYLEFLGAGKYRIVR